MPSSVSSRTASTYPWISLEAPVREATWYELVKPQLAEVIKSAGAAGDAFRRGNIAASLNGLCGYCAPRLTEINLRNYDGSLPYGCKQIGRQASAALPLSH